ncbi:MAG: site-specific integrase [Proteobacteria bacterium]|nr:site-specific integrase [Pseudomonadota bacterium]
MLNKREQVKDNNNKKVTGVFQRVSSEKTFKSKPDICFDICYKHKGKLYWEKIGWLSQGYSVKNAVDTRNERIRSIRKHIELPRENQKAPLFKDVAKKYLEWCKDNKCRNGYDERIRYEKHLEPRFANKRLNEISPFDLEKMKSQLLKSELAPSTVKHVLILFRMIWNKALIWDMWKGENPVKQVKLPKVQNERERFLSFQEAEILLQALKESSLIVHDMALLSLHCGLRFGEITALRGVDIDLANGLINIADPKNKTSRKAYITKTVKTMLQAHIPENREDFIFFPRGEKKQITHISATFHRTVKELGFNNGITDRRQWISFHSLRHTHASWLALSGESLLVIREALGHKDFTMTKRYAHLGADTRKQAATRLEQAFNKGKESNVVHLNEQ